MKQDRDEVMKELEAQACNTCWTPLTRRLFEQAALLLQQDAEELVLAKQRGDEWRKKFDADTDEIAKLKAERDRLREGIGFIRERNWLAGMASSKEIEALCNLLLEPQSLNPPSKPKEVCDVCGGDQEIQTEGPEPDDIRVYPCPECKGGYKMDILEALRPFAQMPDYYDLEDDVVVFGPECGSAITAGDIRRAQEVYRLAHDPKCKEE
jgi:hypothetical protein